MWAIKLCANKIFQFLTGGAGYGRLTRVMAVKQWLLCVLYCMTDNVNHAFLSSKNTALIKCYYYYIPLWWWTDNITEWIAVWSIWHTHTYIQTLNNMHNSQVQDMIKDRQMYQYTRLWQSQDHEKTQDRCTSTKRITFTDLYWVTSCRALSSCELVANKLSGFVVMKKCFARPMYVLWSYCGSSMLTRGLALLSLTSAVILD